MGFSSNVFSIESRNLDASLTQPPLKGKERPEPGISLLAAAGAAPVVWEISGGLTPYGAAVERMEMLARDIAAGTMPETVWLVEHAPLYTAGTSARVSDLLQPDRFPVFETGRGGEYTYHGPGQRVAYVMLDLTRRKQDVRAYVAALEAWIIASLADFKVTGERREDRVGVWVRRPEKAPLVGGINREDKIAAIGIRLRKWVSFHGMAININNDLSIFDSIVPCGLDGVEMTSVEKETGQMADMDTIKQKLKRLCLKQWT